MVRTRTKAVHMHRQGASTWMHGRMNECDRSVHAPVRVSGKGGTGNAVICRGDTERKQRALGRRCSAPEQAQCIHPSIHPSIPLSLPPSLPPSLPSSLPPSLPPSLPLSLSLHCTHAPPPRNRVSKRRESSPIRVGSWRNGCVTVSECVNAGVGLELDLEVVSQRSSVEGRPGIFG